MQHALEIEPHFAAIAPARRWAHDLLSEAGIEGETLNVMILLVSEVVTNAVGHAHSGGQMVLTEMPSGLRVEVSDKGAGEVAPRDAGPEDVTGRGMAIVAALATRWGVHEGAPDAVWYKTVWFEVDVARDQSGSISVTSRRSL